MAENRTKTASPQRGPGRPFEPGRSGNPGGRPKGLTQLVREKTRDGEDIVDFMLKAFQGKVKGLKPQHRLEAATWLADRGYGKATQPTLDETPQPNLFEGWDPEEVRAVLEGVGRLKDMPREDLELFLAQARIDAQERQEAKR